MKEKIIGIKELHRKLKDVSLEVSQGRSFLVVKNSKPAFKIVPLEDDKPPKYTMADITLLQTKSHDGNLSKKVDEIVYQ